MKNRPSTSQSPEKLAAYAGDYYSDELMVTYKVTAGEGGLVLKTPIKSRYMMDLTGITGSDPLRPLEKDKYRFAFMYVIFQRNARGKVIGFTLIHQRAGLRMKFAKTWAEQTIGSGLSPSGQKGGLSVIILPPVQAQG